MVVQYQFSDFGLDHEILLAKQVVPPLVSLNYIKSTPAFHGTSTLWTLPEAFRKPVLSSSFRSATEHAYKAVDGDLESQWASVALNDQWLWVDLLGLYAVKRVVVLFGDVPQQFVPGTMVWPR